MVRVTELQNLYAGLWARLSVACKGYVVRPKYSNGFQCEQGDGVVLVRSLLRFKEFKSHSHLSKHVDVVVRSIEKIDVERKIAKYSSVEVFYLAVAGDVPKFLLLAIRFEYSGTAQPAHPVFHAHLASVSIPVDELSSVGLVGGLPQNQAEFASARIPTPYMNCVSVLLGLAADHLNHDRFKGFLKDLRTGHVRKAYPPVHGLQKSFEEYRDYCNSHHWYENV